MMKKKQKDALSPFESRKKALPKGQRTKAEVIKNKVSIDERPVIVETKKRFGDWEIDTVLGKHGTGSIVTLLERRVLT